MSKKRSFSFLRAVFCCSTIFEIIWASIHGVGKTWGFRIASLLFCLFTVYGKFTEHLFQRPFRRVNNDLLVWALNQYPLRIWEQSSTRYKESGMSCDICLLLPVKNTNSARLPWSTTSHTTGTIRQSELG